MRYGSERTIAAVIFLYLMKEFEKKVNFVFRFKLTVNDSPGGVNKLCAFISNAGVSVIDIVQERRFTSDMYGVEV